MTNEAFALFLLLTIAVISVVQRRNELAFRAVAIHNLAWIGSLGILALNLIDYDGVRAETWMLIAFGVLAYNLGAALAAVKSRPSVSLNPVGAVITRTGLTTLVLLFFVGALGFTYYIGSRFGYAVLVSDPGSIRSNRIGPGYLESIPLPVKLLFYLGPLVFVLLSNATVVSNHFGKRTRFVLAVLVLAAQAVTLQRTNIFICLFWQLGVVATGPGFRSSRWATAATASRRRFLGAIAVAAIALFSFQAIGGALGKTQAQTSATEQALDARLSDSGFGPAAIYATSGIPAFNNLFRSPNDDWPVDSGSAEDSNPLTWGSATFNIPLRAIPGVRTWGAIAPFTTVPFRTNVYTWYEPYYRDFREFGVLLGSMLVGFGTARLLRKANRLTSWAVPAGLVTGLSAWAPFTNKYISLIAIECFLVSVWLVRRSRRSQRAGLTSSRIATTVGDRVGEDVRPPASARVDSETFTPPVFSDVPQRR